MTIKFYSYSQQSSTNFLAHCMQIDSTSYSAISQLIHISQSTSTICMQDLGEKFCLSSYKEVKNYYLIFLKHEM